MSPVSLLLSPKKHTKNPWQEEKLISKVIFSKNVRNQSNKTKASVGTDAFSKTIKEIPVWVAQQWDVEVTSLKAIFFNGLFW